MEILKVSHSITASEMKKIVSNIRNISSALDTYKKNKDESQDQAMYNARYLKKISDKALESLVSTTTKCVNLIDTSIELIQDAERKNNEIFEMDSEALQKAVALVNAIGSKMSYATIEDIITQFKGQYKALNIIKELFETNNIDIPEHCEKYFYNIDYMCEDLSDFALAVGIHPTNVSALAKLLRCVQEMNDILGIDLDSKMFQGAVSDNVYTNIMRSAMGLPLDY